MRTLAGSSLALLCMLGGSLACPGEEGTNTTDLGGARMASKASAPAPVVATAAPASPPAPTASAPAETAAMPSAVARSDDRMAELAPPAPAEPTKSSATEERASASRPVVAAANHMVWVDLDAKIFYPAGARWYGKTKKGQLMTETEALAAGYHEAPKARAERRAKAAARPKAERRVWAAAPPGG